MATDGPLTPCGYRSKATLDMEGLLAVIPLLLMSSPGSQHRFVVCTRSASGLIRGLVHDCSGAVAVEFLVVLGPLLLLLLGTFDIGLVMLTEMRINFAVEAAARCGAVSAGMCASAPQTAAYGASIAALPRLAASGFSVTTAACGINVTASYPYSGMVLPAMTLSAGACYPLADAT